MNNNVTPIFLLAHTSDHLQPLDCGVNSHLKSVLADKYSEWRSRRPNVPVGIAEKNLLIMAAHKAIPAHVVRSAWERAGLVSFVLTKRTVAQHAVSLVTSTASVATIPPTLPDDWTTTASPREAGIAIKVWEVIREYVVIPAQETLALQAEAAKQRKRKPGSICTTISAIMTNELAASCGAAIQAHEEAVALKKAKSASAKVKRHEMLLKDYAAAMQRLSAGDDALSLTAKQMKALIVMQYNEAVRSNMRRDDVAAMLAAAIARRPLDMTIVGSGTNIVEESEEEESESDVSDTEDM